VKKANKREGGPEPTRERLIFIDALRGYAILMMLQGHTIGVVLAEEYRDTSYPAYLVWHYLTGLTAPVFFLAAGLIFAYLLARAEEGGSSRLQKGVKRGLWLMVLGWILQLWPPILVDFAKGDFWALGRIFGKSHVLHTIGWALIMMVVLWLACGRRGKVFAGVALVLAQLALLGGPAIERWAPEGGVARLVATFVAREYAAFPIFPWVGYSLMGGALGVLAWQVKWYRSRKSFLILMGVGLVLMFGNQLITGAFWSLVGGVAEEDVSQFAGRYWRAGEVIFFTGLVGLLCRFLIQKNWDESWPVRIVTTCGQETLTIYFLHVFVVYSVVFGVGLSAFFKREFGPWQSVATALAIQAAFILLAINLQKLRKVCPWLRLLR
jgi:uncharacterized membrane protein